MPRVSPLFAVYDADSLTLLAGATAGDATLDGRVDAADLMRVRRNLGIKDGDWLSGDLPEQATPLALLSTAWLALSLRRGVSRRV